MRLFTNKKNLLRESRRPSLDARDADAARRRRINYRPLATPLAAPTLRFLPRATLLGCPLLKRGDVDQIAIVEAIIAAARLVSLKAAPGGAVGRRVGHKLGNDLRRRQ